MYDFGSTTELALTVMSNIWRKSQKDAVRLLARNAPLVFQCADCGKKAEFIDAYENDFYCMECSDKYENDEIATLPVTNSPRMGVCGYDGELDDFEFNPDLIKL
jgi:DNA-directed RNA polymerase subunit RPC12/RpoP